MCAAVLRLATTAQHNQATLIWYPGVTQAVLNHILRAIYIGRESTGTHEPSNVALAHLLGAAEECKRRMGFNDPATLNLALAALPAPERVSLLIRIAGVRLLHHDRHITGTSNEFPKHLAAWRAMTGPGANVGPEAWQTLLGRATAGPPS
jgi:hypothetical protein